MPSERSQRIPEPDEGTPLLSKGNTPPKETPLPTQVLVLLFLQLAEPITSLSIRPYVNQVRSSSPLTYITTHIRLSLLVSSQSLVVTKGKSDTMQALLYVSSALLLSARRRYSQVS